MEERICPKRATAFDVVAARILISKSHFVLVATEIGNMKAMNTLRIIVIHVVNFVIPTSTSHFVYLAGRRKSRIKLPRYHCTTSFIELGIANDGFLHRMPLAVSAGRH